MRIRIIHFLFLSFFTSLSIHVRAQNIQDLLESIKNEQIRLDAYDGVLDEKTAHKTTIQTERSSRAYIIYPNIVIADIKKLKNLQLQILQLKHLLSWYQSISKERYPMYNIYLADIEMVMKVQRYSEERASLVLKSMPNLALRLIPFFLEEPYSQDVIFAASEKFPFETLRQFGKMANKSWSYAFIAKMADESPTHLKGYLGSQNKVRMVFDKLQTPAARAIREIFKSYGSETRTYLLLDDIINNRYNIKDAHSISVDSKKLFNRLVHLRYYPKVYASNSIDEELKLHSLRIIRKVNDLHDRSDQIRFKPFETMNARALYTLAVYGEEEIFTSTFLGLFARLLPKINEESNFEFVHNLGLNKLSTWLKICANYNVFNAFVDNMTTWEKKVMFKHLFQGLSKKSGDLKHAVTVVNTYTSLRNSANKELFANALLHAAKDVRLQYWDKKLYELILHITKIKHSTVMENDLQQIGVENLLWKDVHDGKEHIQQHFFYDDADGVTSFATFLHSFNHTKWKIEDFKTYVRIKSTSGKKVTIYANKNKYEYEGQSAIEKIFRTTGKFPNVVVHRGHSYYANIAITSITPNAKLVFLGSCGGYNNISKVLLRSPNAHIISSRQVGTYLINNQISLRLCEWIRLGKDLEWSLFWNELKRNISNKKAQTMFEEYVAPNKNLGAFLLKSYKELIDTQLASN